MDAWADPMAEREFWDSLNDEEAFTNTAGVPAYNVGAVSEIIVDFLDLPHGSWVLDLGCGVGRLTECVADDGTLRIVGFDISEKMIWKAIRRSYTGTIYVVGDGRNIPAMSNVFAGAYSVTMFQHIPHEAMWDYIMQVHRLLPDDGKFIFTVAVGDEPDTFLHYQISDPEAFALNLTSLFSQVQLDGPDERGWAWVRCIK